MLPYGSAHYSYTRQNFCKISQIFRLALLGVNLFQTLTKTNPNHSRFVFVSKKILVKLLGTTMIRQLYFEEKSCAPTPSTTIYAGAPTPSRLLRTTWADPTPGKNPGSATA